MRHRRWIKTVWARRAVVGSLLVCALGARPGVARAADAPPETDAQRIARVRDTVAAGARDQQQQPLTSDAEQAEEAPAEAEAAIPLPPNENLPLGVGEGGMFSDVAAGDTETTSLGDGWVLSTLAALGVVLALVFGIRWLLRRSGVVTASAPQGSVVEVLSRTTVAPRSHVLLMRVGQRVLVVNDSASGMRTLATVEEPDEVAELLGAVEADRPTSMTRSFSSVMSRLSGHWSTADEALDPEAPDDATGEGLSIDRTRGAVSSVRGRLAALADGGIKA